MTSKLIEGCSRRSLVAAPVAAGAAQALFPLRQLLVPAVGAVGITTATDARAEPVTICLAVASAVAGLVAAHNRSDGGMGAVLTANLEYQRVLSKQLGSVQQGMAEILTKVNALPDEMRKLLHAERLAALHKKLGTQILRYRQESIRSANFQTYTAWTEDRQTRSILADINIQLDQAAADVVHSRWYDALTALYLTAAVYTSLAVRSALGDKAPQLKPEAQRYLNMFSAVERSDEAGSAAADLAARGAAIRQLKRELARQRFVVRDDDSTRPESVRVGWVAVQDFTPSTLLETRGDCKPVNRSKPDFGETCVERPIYSSQRVGDVDAFGFFAGVVPRFEVGTHEGAQSIAIRQYSVGEALTTANIPNVAEEERANNWFGLGPGKVFKSAPVVRVDARTPTARKAAAEASEQHANAVAAHKLLQTTVTKLNEELARAALDGAALMAVSSTRQGVFRFFGQGA